MIVVICVDDNGGIRFNHRRQSQDRLLREHLLQRTAGSRLWMNAYSAKQFDPNGPFMVDEHCLDKAAPGEYCFVEDQDIVPYESNIESILLYKWNRIYPADQHFPLSLEKWKLVAQVDFPGSSHEKITEEVYTRCT